MTKTNTQRTNRQNVAEAFNRLAWPIIGELVKLSAISCSYYRSTFSCTGVTPLCVAATSLSCEFSDYIMLANLIFVAAVLEQPGEFRCKAAVDWITWASTSLLARWPWLTQIAAKRRFARRRSTSSNWDQVCGYGPTLLNIRMGVKLKIKDCLWSESPGYFFLASLRPPTIARHFLLPGLDQSQSAMDDSCQWETSVDVSANDVCTQFYIDMVGWSTTPKHHLSGIRFSGSCFFDFLFFLIN